MFIHIRCNYVKRKIVSSVQSSHIVPIDVNCVLSLHVCTYLNWVFFMHYVFQIWYIRLLEIMRILNNIFFIHDCMKHVNRRHLWRTCTCKFDKTSLNDVRKTKTCYNFTEIIPFLPPFSLIIFCKILYLRWFG